VIEEAKRHGIRLILSLANNLDAYGGKSQYVKWAWEEGIGMSVSNDSFFFDPSIKSYFKSYLKVNQLISHLFVHFSLLFLITTVEELPAYRPWYLCISIDT
jgi:endo-1,4-beta-mannosidase